MNIQLKTYTSALVLDPNDVHSLDVAVVLSTNSSYTSHPKTHLIVALDIRKPAYMYVSHLISHIESNKNAHITLIGAVNIPTLLISQSNDTGDILQALEAYQTEGTTDITEILSLAIDTAIRYKINYWSTNVVLFTDKEWDPSTSIESWHCGYVNTINSTTIHTLSIGTEPDAEALIKISNMSAGGRYMHIPNNSDDIAYSMSVVDKLIVRMNTQSYSDCMLIFEASPGTRIVRINGPVCPHSVFIPVKKHIYNIGNLCTGDTKAFICKLSVNRGADVAASDGKRQYKAYGLQELMSVTCSGGGACVVANVVVMRADITFFAQDTTMATRCSFSETVQYICLRDTLTDAIGYADKGDFVSAILCVGTTISYFKSILHISPSRTISRFIGDLKQMLRMLCVDAYNRSECYAMLSLYNQQASISIDN